ncbi:MAG: hypothetical protein ACR2F6_01850 [Mycobacteriales bacterium]
MSDAAPPPAGRAPTVRSVADDLYDAFLAAIRGRARFGRVDRLDDRTVRVFEDVATAGQSARPSARSVPRGAPMTVRVLTPDRLRIEIGELGTASIGCAGATVAERSAATAIEAVEWLDAVLDGRVRETFVVLDGTRSESRLVITWRDGTRTRIATPGIARAEAETHQRLHARFPRYAGS